MSYFDTNPISKSNENTIKVSINNRYYIFNTDNDVFSKKGLDFGTRTLLENIDISSLNGDILDLGCGYGPIGIHIADVTKLNVDMVDINKRALVLAQKNSSRIGATTNVFESDGFLNINKKYDYIITNPPIRVGKKILYELLFTSKKHLKDSGHLILVINKDQGAKSLIRDLSEIYEVNILTKNKGFYVIDCQNH